MLSTPAFNALLKTLEEPPVTWSSFCAPPIRRRFPKPSSRVASVSIFRPISPEAMVSRSGAICVSEDVEFEGEALDLIAHRAEGGTAQRAYFA